MSLPKSTSSVVSIAACAAGCPATDGERCLGRPCARRAWDFGNHHRASCASRTDIGRIVFRRRGHALAHGCRIARRCACPRRVGCVLGLSRSSGCDRGKSRRCKHSARHSPSDILGRAWRWLSLPVSVNFSAREAAMVLCSRRRRHHGTDSRHISPTLAWKCRGRIKLSGRARRLATGKFPSMDGDLCVFFGRKHADGATRSWSADRISQGMI